MRLLGEKDKVRARKWHVCGLCGRRIGPGTHHYTQRCADSGSVWTWRAHRPCWYALPTWCEVVGHEIEDVLESAWELVDDFAQWIDEATR